MRRLIVIGFLFVSLPLFGQQLNFRQVDTAMYNQYLRGEWKNMITTGKAALDNDIDYYYLQLRMAYAYFSMEKYRPAIKHYKEALFFNSADPVANEYLYYCYKFSGMPSDALHQVSSLSEMQKNSMELNRESKIISAGFSFASSFSDASGIADQIVNDLTSINDGVQKATYNLNAPQLNLAHYLGDRVIVRHQASLIFKNEMSYVISDGTAYYSPEQPLRQFEYSIGLDILLAEGLILRPGIHYVRASIPLYLETSYGPGMNRDRTAVAYVTLRDWVPRIELVKQTRYFDAGISYVYNTFNETATHQFGFHGTIYPFGNLNLYARMDAYHQSLENNTVQKARNVFSPMAGFRIHKNFWLETGATFPEQFNFYDIRNNIAYNNIDTYVTSYDITGIIPLYKPKLNLYIGYKYQSINSYFYEIDSMLEPINQHLYHSHLITGGISWTM